MLSDLLTADLLGTPARPRMLRNTAGSFVNSPASVAFALDRIADCTLRAYDTVKSRWGCHEKVDEECFEKRATTGR